MTKIRSPWPPSPRLLRTMQNEEDGQSEILRQPAENIATLVRYITGELGVEATKAPQGEYGHDHSGGRWGKPLFRSVATSSGDHHELYSSDVTRNGVLWTWSVGRQSGEDFNLVAPPPWIHFAPPCEREPSLGAYAVQGVYAVLYMEVESGDVNDTVEVFISNRHPDSQREIKIFDLTGTDGTGVHVYESDGSASPHMTFIPGEANSIRVRADIAFDADATNRTFTFTLAELEFGVKDT